MKKEVSPKESLVKNDHQWAYRVEKILREWLIEQPYSTKLAFVLLDGCRLADDGTQALFSEISEKYKAEIIDSAEELPGTLHNKEVFLTGIAADMLHSEERMFELSETSESDDNGIVVSSGELGENKSMTDSLKSDNSNKNTHSK
jgi:hypothetical protein